MKNAFFLFSILFFAVNASAVFAQTNDSTQQTGNASTEAGTGAKRELLTSVENLGTGMKIELWLVNGQSVVIQTPLQKK